MKWLILRRLSQLTILILFLLGPVAGIWIIKGSMAGSMTLDVLPLTDPLVLLQTFLAAHSLSTTALVGGIIALSFYLLVGGRVFCSWVCPVNIINDGAGWLRKRTPLEEGSIGTNVRYWLLAFICIMAIATGSAAWEDANPVNIVGRSLVFLESQVIWIMLTLFMMGVLMKGGWCRICPTGAIYSLIGYLSPLKVRSRNREDCDHCNACYQVCPEPHVLVKPLQNKVGSSPVIISGQCTNCGRCIDVCHKKIFKFGSRF